MISTRAPRPSARPSIRPGATGARRAPAVAVATVAVLLAGCSASSPDDAPSEAEVAGDDEAAVVASHEAYWDAVVSLYAGEGEDDALAGVAKAEWAEETLTGARASVDGGTTMEGRPTFSDVQVEVSGDTAVVASCFDATDWRPAETVATEQGASPMAMTLEKVDGAWVVTGTTQAPADLTC